LSYAWDDYRVSDVELVMLEWVDWFNKTRPHSKIGYVSSFESEKWCYDNLIQSVIAAWFK